MTSLTENGRLGECRGDNKVLVHTCPLCGNPTSIRIMSQAESTEDFVAQVNQAFHKAVNYKYAGFVSSLKQMILAKAEEGIFEFHFSYACAVPDALVERAAEEVSIDWDNVKRTGEFPGGQITFDVRFCGRDDDNYLHGENDE